MSEQKGKNASGATGRYVLRHICRSPGKSLLCLLLATVFMLGLMLIRVSTVRSENELENLYLTTTVTVEIIRTNSAQVTTSGGISSGFIYLSTVDKLTDTGFIGHRYVEANVEHATLTRLDEKGKAVGNGAFRFGNATLCGIEYPQEYFASRNMEVDLTYFEGWDESVFLQSQEDWRGKGSAYLIHPAVVSQELYDMLKMEEGDMLQVELADSDPLSMKTITYTTDLTIVGTHQGDMATVFLPVNSLRGLKGVDLKYERVGLTIDPTMNRQLDEFRDQASNIVPGGGTVSLTAIYWDQELRQAIAPMEQVISFMKALYPVTLGLSFIVAAGIAVLLSLLSAKEAAILRVLGNSKAQCRAVLCLQTVLVCMVGLILGHLGAVAMAYLMLPAEDAAGLLLPALGRVGLYLLYTILGAVGASAVMTGKNPLELLQVKE